MVVRSKCKCPRADEPGAGAAQHELLLHEHEHEHGLCGAA